MGKPPRNDDVKRQAGLRLRCVREVLGLDQASFAQAIGVGTNALGNWERGERLPDVLAMQRMFDRFAFTLEWIYGGRLQWMDYAVQEQLRARAAAHSTVIGATVAEWPTASERREALVGIEPAARIAARK